MLEESIVVSALSSAAPSTDLHVTKDKVGSLQLIVLTPLNSYPDICDCTLQCVRYDTNLHKN